VESKAQGARSASRPSRGGAGQRSHGPSASPYASLGRKLSSEQECDLAARVKAGDRAARDELIVANLPLVVFYASHYESCGMTRDDLIQEATLGLIRAVERFDPQTHGARFSSYATYWICQAIQRSLAKSDSLIRVPDYMWRLQNRFRRLMSQIRNEEYESVAAVETGPEDLAGRMGISVRQLSLLCRSRRERSSSQVDEEDREIGLEELVPDRYEPQRELDRLEQLEELRRAIDTLPAVEAWVIRRRFGMADPEAAAPGESHGGESRDYDAMARILGVSRHRIKGAESMALRRLRRLLGVDADTGREREPGR
jgi:RNA polymerase sigma factor (sigma-70 family)